MYEFRFADIGEGITEGTLLELMFEPGDQVKEGDSLFLVETDKVNADIPSPVTGKIVEYKAKVGEVIHVGEVVVVIDDGSASPAKESDPTASEKEKTDPTKARETKQEDIKTTAPEKEAVAEEETAGVVGQIEVSSDIIANSDENASTKEESSSGGKVLATPVARQMAKDLGVDITTIKGTGPVGRVMKEDIAKAAENLSQSKAQDSVTASSQPTAPPIPIAADRKDQIHEIPLTMLRKTIAKNMVLSKSVIPHAASMDEFDVTSLVDFRNENKAMAGDRGIKLTYMAFIVKAVTLALEEFEVFNASYDEERQVILAKKYYNIGIATDTPDGLIVPVIKDANHKSILSIAREIEELTEKAKNRTLDLSDLQDSTFTLTNFGAMGTPFGIPVIKHPETAILGIGKIAKKPLVVDESIQIRDVLPLTLCIDHRVIDGGDAGRFLNKLRDLLSHPTLLLMS